MFYLDKGQKKGDRSSLKISVGFMISEKYFHNGTAYEHQMRVELLLSKFNWPKVSSLA